MAKWLDLPLEIRSHILSLFCRDISNDFSVPLASADVDSDVLAHMRNINVLSLEHIKFGKSKDIWPRGPAPLQSLSSALRTCYDFYNIICHCVKFEEKSTVEIFEDTQYRLLRNLVESLEDLAQHRFITGGLDIRRVFGIMGCFWRNSYITQKSESDSLFSMSFLWYWLDGKSRVMLAPHLEPWLIKTSVSSLVRERYMYVVSGEIGIVRGSMHSEIHEEFRSDCTITTLENVHPLLGTCEEAWTCINDIKKDPPDSWWFYPRIIMESEGYEMEDECYGFWIIINYRRKIMHYGPKFGNSFYWLNEWEPMKTEEERKQSETAYFEEW
jgi:hypothetical protein